MAVVAEASEEEEVEETAGAVGSAVEDAAEAVTM